MDRSIYPAEVHASRITIAGEPYIMGLATDITSRKEKDATVQESEEMFRGIFENLQDIYYRTDADGIVTMLSPSAAGIFGSDTTDAMIGKPTSDFWVHPEERMDIVRRIAEEGGVRDYEVTLKKAAGSPLPVSVSCRQIYDGSGKAAGIEGVIRDITKRKEMERAIQSQLDLIEGLFESLPLGVVIMDPGGEVLLMNRGVEEITGYTPEEIRTMEDWFLRAYPDPPYRDEVLSIWNSDKEEGVGSRECKVTCKDGTFRDIEFHAAFLADGRDIVTISDVTERRRADEEKERNEYRFSLLASQSRAYTWEVDAEGLFTSIGPESEAITGYMPDEIVGKLHFYDLHPEENREEFKRAAMKVFARREPFRDFENSAIRKSGELFWVSTSGIPLVDDSGCLIGYWGTDTDITERKLAEDALRTANQKLQILSSITRHDIQNKIMVLQAYLDLTRPEVDDPKLSQYLSEVDRAGSDIQRQIEFTRTYQELGVERAAWHAIDDLLSPISGSELPLFAGCIGYQILADPMIQKVFENLMENTIRHAKGASRVEIRCEERNGQLAIIWEDDGGGVPDNQKERIFERGYGENTGLGLFLSQEILAITGITIAETGEYGKGARFEMLVPEGAWRKSEAEI